MSKVKLRVVNSIDMRNKKTYFEVSAMVVAFCTYNRPSPTTTPSNEESWLTHHILCPKRPGNGYVTR
jgi:hypothetical protein